MSRHSAYSMIVTVNIGAAFIPTEGAIEARVKGRLDMSKMLKRVLMMGLVLGIALFGLAQRSIAYERSKGQLMSADAKALALAARARIDLVRRLGLDANQIVVQSIDAVVFPDGSLGAAEPNKAYPLAATPGHSIRFRVENVVYRYWAANGRIVYVGSFVEPTVAVENQRTLWDRRPPLSK
jgi:hypothetical protein